MEVKEELKREGFWISTEEPNLPKPKPGVLSLMEAVAIHSLIVAKQHQANVVSYRGKTLSRITGEGLGYVEYRLDGWCWPGDFAEHYVLQNKVKPSHEFLSFIGFQN